MGQYFKGIKAGQLTAITEADANLIDKAGNTESAADGVRATAFTSARSSRLPAAT